MKNYTSYRDCRKNNIISKESWVPQNFDTMYRFKGVPDGIKGVFVGAMETNNTSHRLGTDIKKTTVISAFG